MPSPVRRDRPPPWAAQEAPPRWWQCRWRRRQHQNKPAPHTRHEAPRARAGLRPETDASALQFRAYRAWAPRPAPIADFFARKAFRRTREWWGECIGFQSRGFRAAKQPSEELNRD